METFTGFHCVTHPDGIGQLIRSGARLVLSVDNVGLLEEAERLRPGINKVMRFFVPNITAESGRRRDPVAFARWYVHESEMAEKIRVNLKALQMPNLWLQAWNEPVFKKPGPKEGIDVDDDEGFDWLAAAEAERVRLLANMGIKAACFALSTGYPTIAQFRRLVPAFPAMRQHGACILIHGYSTNEEMAANTDDCNRHEMYFNEVTKPAGFADIPFAYGEAGREWQAQGIDAPTYRDQIARYDTRIRNFVRASGCRMLGFALYTLGDDVHRTWGRYKLDGKMPELLSEYLEQIERQPEPVPVPQPPPPTPAPEPPKPAPSTRFKKRDRYVVTATDGLNMRLGPAGRLVSRAKFGDKGVIMDGPVVARLSVTSPWLNWWLCKPDNDPAQLWMAESFPGDHDYLALETPPPPPLPDLPAESVVFVEQFNNGFHTPDPARDNMRVPNGWVQWFADESTPRIDGQDATQFWIPGEGIMRDANSLHVSELDTMLKRPDGTRAESLYHYFRGWGRLWHKLTRTFNLRPSAYRVEFEFWPDILLEQKIQDNRIVKTPDTNPLNNEFRFVIGGRPIEFTLGDRHPAGQYTRVEKEFDWNGGDIILGGEWRARWGVLVVGWFLREFKIVKLA